MEWRCEWCGKPHAADDPPCDNCGHGTFERAVVPAPGGEVGTGATTVWVCPSCGRDHPKHSPPCSRCGNPNLERQERDPEEYDIGAPSYRELLTPRYLVMLVAVLALAGVFVLGVTGVVDVPGLTQGGVPTVSDVPGSGTSANGIDLNTVETELVVAMNDRRVAANHSTLTRDDHLDAVATFYTERLVKARTTGGSIPGDDRLRDMIGGSCGSNRVLLSPRILTGSDSVSAHSTAEAAASTLASPYPLDNEVSREPAAGLVGLAIHAGSEETTYLTRIVC